MTVALGIDAGGTYTDVVVYSLRDRAVSAKAKSLTTPGRYSEGIAEALRQLPRKWLKVVRFVGLSTTLATNAVVTGRRSRAGLILMGYPTRSFELVTFSPKRRVTGAIRITGEERVALDEDELRATAAELLSAERVGAIAISEMNSVMNPAHELRAAALVREAADVPVVLGSQLSMKLNAVRRAITAGTNAELLPLISELLASVQEVLSEMGVRAPLAVVRCDGTLMGAELAAERPIETILSGPAASMVGACRLSRRSSALVVDMGGTTTDVAILSGGRVRTSPDGATVGGLRTSVLAVDTRTHGLGGDSYVRFRKDEITVGPERVIPLSLLADRYPCVIDRLRERTKTEGSLLVEPVDFFVARQRKAPSGLTKRDAEVLAALANGPLPRTGLSRKIGAVHESLLQIGHLERQGLVGRSALTPTDALHLTGAFSAWSVEAAKLAMEICARRAGCRSDELAETIVNVVRRDLARHLVEAQLAGEGHDVDSIAGSRLLKVLYEKALRFGADGGSDGRLAVSLKLACPLIGVGAPIAAYLPMVANQLGADCIVPEHADVAGAVGAASSWIVIEIRGTITRLGRQTYACHCEDGRFDFDSLAKAKEFLRDHLRQLAEDRAAKAGADRPDVQVELTDRFGSGIDERGLTEVYLETLGLARAEGRPAQRKTTDTPAS